MRRLKIRSPTTITARIHVTIDVTMMEALLLSSRLIPSGGGGSVAMVGGMWWRSLCWLSSLIKKRRDYKDDGSQAVAGREADNERFGEEAPSAIPFDTVKRMALTELI